MKPGVQNPHCKRVTVAKCLLYGAEPPISGATAFGRGDVGAFGRHREHQAGPHRLSVDKHRASAADAMLAADMGAGELRIVSDGVGQQPARRHRHRVRHSVDRQRDVVHRLRRHRCPHRWARRPHRRRRHKAGPPHRDRRRRDSAWKGLVQGDRDTPPSHGCHLRARSQPRPAQQLRRAGPSNRSITFERLRRHGQDVDANRRRSDTDQRELGRR